MFILTKGRVHVEKATRQHGVQVLASLSDGSFFGEQALLFGTYRNATVRSLSFCNVCALHKEQVDFVLDKVSERAGSAPDLHAVVPSQSYGISHPLFRSLLLSVIGGFFCFVGAFVSHHHSTPRTSAC